MSDNDVFPNEDLCGFFDSTGTWWRIEPCGEGYGCEEYGCGLPAFYEASCHPNDEDWGWCVLCVAHMCAFSGLFLTEDEP